MTTASTRRVFRAQRKDARSTHRERIALGVLTARLSHGCLADLAAAAGVSDALWKRWEDPDDSATISMADVATLADIEPEAGLAILRLLTEPMGQMLSPRPECGVDIPGWMVRLGRMGRTFHEVPATLAEALADERLDPAELRELREKLAAAMELAAEGLGEVDIALEEHGTVVPLTAKGAG